MPLCAFALALRPMDWDPDAHAQKYWKDKPSAQAKKPDNSKRTLLVGGAMVFLAICGASSIWRARSRRLAAEEEAKKVVKLPPISLSSVKPEHSDSCIGEAGERDFRYTYLQCRQRCANMKDILPAPTMWRSCLSGCEKGAQAAIRLGCTTITDVPHCENEVKKQCKSKEAEGFCASLVHEEPKPALFEMCSTNCQGELVRACDRAITSLAGLRRPRSRREL